MEMELKRTFWPEGKSFSFELIIIDQDTNWYPAIDFWNQQLRKEAAKVLSEKMFEGLLSEDEIIELFGNVPIPPEWESWKLESRWIKTNKLDKFKIKHLTRKIRRWWIRGLKKCESAVKEKYMSPYWLKDKFTVWKTDLSSD
jgi:hypothetical protein